MWSSLYKKQLVVIVVIAIGVLISCSGPQRGIFASKTAHEKYTDNLNKAGLDQTALGRTWLTAASKALQQPLSISLPFKETGYFSATQPGVAGYRFSARRGDQLVIELSKKPVQGFTLFLDLWKPESNEPPRLLAATDSTAAGISFEVKKDGEYLLRLQPELLAGGEYTLTVRTAPSLAFPVQTSANPRIASFWGDTRDAGARSHEGIDIFGKKHTPLLAAEDGVIRSAGTNNLGGKVIFMRPKDKDYVLYYAHLDSQLVQGGQQVKKGDIIGLMGNTGNARTTPPHLHFGIYAPGGAIDPLPFVDRDRPQPPTIKASLEVLNKVARSEKKTFVYTMPDKKSVKLDTLEASTIVNIKGAMDAWYKIELPDGREGFIADADVNSIDKPLRKHAVSSIRSLLDKPDSLAAAKRVIHKDDDVEVLGVFNNFYYVRKENQTGWIRK